MYDAEFSAVFRFKSALQISAFPLPDMARWQFCNILHVGTDAYRLWQFEAKGGGFTFNREHAGAPANRCRSTWWPSRGVPCGSPG